MNLKTLFLLCFQKPEIWSFLNKHLYNFKNNLCFLLQNDRRRFIPPGKVVSASWKQEFEKFLAFFTPPHDSIGSGFLNRSFPTGGLAKGIPRNAPTLPFNTGTNFPWTFPFLMVTKRLFSSTDEQKGSSKMMAKWQSVAIRKSWGGVKKNINKWVKCIEIVNLNCVLLKLSIIINTEDIHQKNVKNKRNIVISLVWAGGCWQDWYVFSVNCVTEVWFTDTRCSGGSFLTS